MDDLYLFCTFYVNNFHATETTIGNPVHRMLKEDDSKLMCEQFMGRVNRTSKESHRRNGIRNTQQEVLFSREKSVRSEAETEVIGNRSGQTFPTARAEEYGPDAPNLVR